jgi:hypothetical protein
VNTDDRDREKIQTFWKRVESALNAYSQFSAVRILHLTNREGVYLFASAIVLIGLTLLAAWPPLASPWSYLPVALAIYYVIDSILINTKITFISQQPIHRLRSVILTLANIFNVALAYAVFYATQRHSFDEPLTALQSIYFSIVTLTTVGYGDISPKMSSASVAQVTIVLELATGLFLLAGVLAIVVSWTQRSEKQVATNITDGPPETNVARGLTRLTIVLVALYWIVASLVLANCRAETARIRAASLGTLLDKQVDRAPLRDWVFLEEHMHTQAGHALDENGYPIPDLIASKNDQRQRRKYVNFGSYPGLESIGGLQFPADTPDSEISRLLPRRLPQQKPTRRDLEIVQEEISLGDIRRTRAEYSSAAAQSSRLWQAVHLFGPEFALETLLALTFPVVLVVLLGLSVFVTRWVVSGFSGTT